MGVLRGFERRLEGAVEGMFARVFRSGLQPIELAKAVQRYCEDHKQVTSTGVVAPNQYRLVLNPEDLERMEAYGSSLHRELAEVVRETCSDGKWSLRGTPTFTLVADDDILLGRFEITARTTSGDTSPGAPSPARAAARPASPSSSPTPSPLFDGDRSGVTAQRPSGAATGAAPLPSAAPVPAVPPVVPPLAPEVPMGGQPGSGLPGDDTPGQSAVGQPGIGQPGGGQSVGGQPAMGQPGGPGPTQSLPAAGSTPQARSARAAPALHLEVLDTGTSMVIRSGRHTIGRSHECDLMIDSTTVSRKHAVLVERNDTWWVFDLGSTNGTRVNGTRASELPVRPGDRLRIGTVDLLVREA